MYGFPKYKPAPIDHRVKRRVYNDVPRKDILAVRLSSDVEVYSDTTGNTRAALGDSIGLWKDISGNNRNFVAIDAVRPTYLNVDGKPCIGTATGYLRCAGSTFALQHIFMVFRSVRAVWNHYGGPLTSHENRAYLLESGGTTLHAYPYPTNIRRNGVSVANTVSLSPVDKFFLLHLTPDSPSTVHTWNIDYAEWQWRSYLYIREIAAYSATLTADEIVAVENALMSRTEV